MFGAAAAARLLALRFFSVYYHSFHGGPAARHGVPPFFLYSVPSLSASVAHSLSGGLPVMRPAEEVVPVASLSPDPGPFRQGFQAFPEFCSGS